MSQDNRVPSKPSDISFYRDYFKDQKKMEDILEENVVILDVEFRKSQEPDTLNQLFAVMTLTDEQQLEEPFITTSGGEMVVAFLSDCVEMDMLPIVCRFSKAGRMIIINDPR